MDRGKNPFLRTYPGFLGKICIGTSSISGLVKCFLHIPHINSCVLKLRPSNLIMTIESDHFPGFGAIGWSKYECRCCLHFYVKKCSQLLGNSQFFVQCLRHVWRNLYHKLVLNVFKFHQENSIGFNGPSQNQWLFLVPIKSRIGSIFHPPEGNISVVYTANWGIICHLPPFMGTRNNH